MTGLALFGALVINEVMNGASDRVWEFIELYNTGPDTVDLAGVKLVEYDHENPDYYNEEYLMLFPLDSALEAQGFITRWQIYPGEYMLIMNVPYFEDTVRPYDTIFPPGQKLIITVGDSLIDNNSYGGGLGYNDWLYLITPDSDTVARAVAYEEIWVEDDYSVERLNPDWPDTAGSWALSMKKWGTPLSRNTVYTPSPPESGIVLEIPNRDLVQGEDLTLKFALSSPSPVYLYIYDDVGRYIDRITYSDEPIQYGTAVYHTGDLRPGIYIVALTSDKETLAKATFRVRR